MLANQPTSILDLGCGPGFYTERLTRLGHTCQGIDYSPASIEYAISTARRDKLACTYVCQDIRQADFPSAIGLVMLIYGEFNVFRLTDAKMLLDKAWQALKPSGTLLLEPHSYNLVVKMGNKHPSWYTSPGGLFSELPHLVLKEYFWDAGLHAATIRYYIMDTQSRQVPRYAQSFQAYKDDEYRSLLTEHGFVDIQTLPGLMGGNSQENLIAIVARKGV